MRYDVFITMKNGKELERMEVYHETKTKLLCTTMDDDLRETFYTINKNEIKTVKDYRGFVLDIEGV